MTQPGLEPRLANNSPNTRETARPTSVRPAPGEPQSFRGVSAPAFQLPGESSGISLGVGSVELQFAARMVVFSMTYNFPS